MSPLGARLLFLLEKAGPHRACELATFLDIPTCEAERELCYLKSLHMTESFEEANSRKWRSIRILDS